ncbi:retrovirus-related pol polyprotein from transposon tnt 1-94 [Phtheirospermum japonicum]|uniref:Retrovirus-related pol polyprotein from transposon tnt 1-94 n=1 Tax=Phtheirospermum japonicum TaxID=374723 RepID=A0A830D6D5_9LAMI|nr:retrovirus-related pol polyprotein from transposon tnt 1-94 [Phtheirospermum japonicum]
MAQSDKYIWYIDTGASFHMTPHRQWFFEYEQYDGGDVMLGDDTAIKITGRGRVNLRMKDDTIKTFLNVMHIPSMSKNLLSVGTMADSGVNFSCDKDSCKMTRGSIVIARGVRYGTLYKLLAGTITLSGGFVSEKAKEDEHDTSLLWHQRMGHIGEKGLSTLFSSQMVEGVPECSMGFGFSRQKTTPYTPQQNGVAERLNRTLMEKARCMLSWAGLEPEFWAEAVATACHLKNRSPTTSVKNRTPYETHVPKEKRGKLDNKSEKNIFIGYKEGVKGYKLWNPESRSIVYNRGVIFHKTQSQDGTQKWDEQTKVVVLEENMRDESEESVTQRTSVENHSDSGSDSDQVNLVDDVDEAPDTSNTPALRRSPRDRRAPLRYSLSALSTGDDPTSVKDARPMDDANQWELAMIDEIQSLDRNETWNLCKLPKDRKAIGCKWIEGVDYDEIFSPVAKVTSIRFVLSIAAAYDLEVEQMDVKMAFLHGDLEEEIYMRQPEGFETKGKENLVCRLKKSLSGLKQSSRMWYQKFDTHMLQLNFIRLNSNHCVYVKRADNQFVILTLYVDDMLLIGNSMKMVKSVKGLLAKKFDMKDLGPANFILGMQIKRHHEKQKLWLGQEKYINEILKKFRMADCKPVGTPISKGTKFSVK